MKNRKIYRSCILVAILLVLCMLPQTAFGKETKEKEYDFNKKKAVKITDAQCYTATNKYIWLKYIPKADGYLTVQISNVKSALSDARGYLALYDGAKTNLLSSQTIYYNATHSTNDYWYKFRFGMVANQTYYLRVRAENGVKLTRKFTKTNDKSGALRSNALILKQNKYKTGLIPAGTTNTDWYRIDLTKQQKLRLFYSAKTNGSFQITVYWGNQQIGSRNIYHTKKERRITFYQYIESTKKNEGLKPGTYYIKVERASTDSSGFYKIKWK